MTRLLGVIFLTIVALIVASYSWNQGPSVTCTTDGLRAAASYFDDRAKTRARTANRELDKLARRTRTNPTQLSINDLVSEWTRGRSSPDPRVCRRLRESLKRLG